MAISSTKLSLFAFLELYWNDEIQKFPFIIIIINLMLLP